MIIESNTSPLSWLEHEDLPVAKCDVVVGEGGQEVVGNVCEEKGVEARVLT